MSREEALQMICVTITEIQQQSGRPVVVLSKISRPFVDIAGFDSLNGEEVTALLSEKLSFTVDFKPFAPAEHDDLTISQIADRLVANAAVKQEAL